MKNEYVIEKKFHDGEAEYVKQLDINLIGFGVPDDVLGRYTYTDSMNASKFEKEVGEKFTAFKTEYMDRLVGNSEEAMKLRPIYRILNAHDNRGKLSLSSFGV